MPIPTLSLVLALAIPVFANVSGAGDTFGPFTPLIASGPLGAVLAWFMWRNERLQRQTAAAMDRMTKSAMLMVAATPTAPAGVRVQARRLVEQIEDIEKARGPVSDEVAG